MVASSGATTAQSNPGSSVVISIGVIRQRTVFFQQCRSSYRQKGSPPLRSSVALAHRVDEKAGLIDNDVVQKDFAVEMAVLPPRWYIPSASRLDKKIDGILMPNP